MSVHAEIPSPLDALARDISISDERSANGNPSAAVSSVSGADRRSVPAHVAIIMDGNGRWATRRGRERTFGHAAGESAILAAIDAALGSGVRWLTLYAFSTENWNRPEEEVAFLMDFNRRLIEKHGERYHALGVRFRYQGLRRAPIPEPVIAAIDQIEHSTADVDTLTLTFAFNYGGRAEILAACQKLIREGADPDCLDERRFEEAFTWPDPVHRSTCSES